MKKRNWFFIICFCCIPLAWATPPASRISEGFVDVREVIPSILLDIRYSTSYNFVGKPIHGYSAPKCYLTKEMADSLKRVQEELSQFSFSLKIYDGYRPQRAVDHFVQWARDVSDTATKREFYPTVDKRNLFRDGYIAGKSSHSRGSAVDLTIVPLPVPRQESYVDSQDLCQCYLSYEKEWWHFTLVDEPYPDTYFDFVIE
jgi:D-alanyl-D-alanine dipeptidase